MNSPYRPILAPAPVPDAPVGAPDPPHPRLGAPAGRFPAGRPAPAAAPVAEAQLASLCAGLQAVGRGLEPAHAARLDLLQEQLTELCQESWPRTPGSQSPSSCSCSR